jgi:hypothetical protein
MKYVSAVTAEEFIRVLQMELRSASEFRHNHERPSIEPGDGGGQPHGKAGWNACRHEVCTIDRKLCSPWEAP